MTAVLSDRRRTALPLWTEPPAVASPVPWPPAEPAWSVRFDAVGAPTGKGSARAFTRRYADGRVGVGVAQGSPQHERQLRSWDNAVRAAAADAMRGELRQGALRVLMVVRLARPRGHFGRRGLLPSAPRYPDRKPDVDKLARAVLDALTGVVWRDDAQVVEVVARKVYALEHEATGAWVVVEAVA